ncbi:four-helix bundle copper-binding protein [Methanocella conradii]|uniref:four-helix bundle copper-binding protein n=1 Tax=Methanocella conradii TaxID=1175444 RepID=UPI0020C632CE|nr:four-helix bundle copper-binding protein [Methanocella conradii]
MRVLKQEKYQSCIEACFDCAESCEACATNCLRDPNVKMLSKCIKLLRDCSDICAVSGRYMSRDSEYARNIGHVIGHYSTIGFFQSFLRLKI